MVVLACIGYRRRGAPGPARDVSGTIAFRYPRVLQGKCKTTVVPQVPAAKLRGSPRWRSQL